MTNVGQDGSHCVGDLIEAPRVLLRSQKHILQDKVCLASSHLNHEWNRFIDLWVVFQIDVQGVCVLAKCDRIGITGRELEHVALANNDGWLVERVQVVLEDRVSEVATIFDLLRVENVHSVTEGPLDVLVEQVELVETETRSYHLLGNEIASVDFSLKTGISDCDRADGSHNASASLSKTGSNLHGPLIDMIFSIVRGHVDLTELNVKDWCRGRENRRN